MSENLLESYRIFSLKALRRTDIAGKSVNIRQQLIEYSNNIYRNFLIQNLLFQILKLQIDLVQYIYIRLRSVNMQHNRMSLMQLFT